MDKIIIENMSFYGYHGILPEEKILGQKFLINVSLYLPLKEAGEKDDLNFSVHYGEVYRTVKGVVTKERFGLLEALAERICVKLFSSYPRIQKIKLMVKKPAAPVHGVFDCIGVEIERTRQG